MATVTSFARDKLYRGKVVGGKLFENNDFQTMISEYKNDADPKDVGEYPDDNPLYKYENDRGSAMADEYSGDHMTGILENDENENIQTKLSEERRDDRMSYLQDGYRENALAAIKNEYEDEHLPNTSKNEHKNEDMPNSLKRISKTRVEYINRNMPNAFSDYNSDYEPNMLNNSDEETVLIVPRKKSPNFIDDYESKGESNCSINGPITMVTSSETIMATQNNRSPKNEQNSSSLFNGEGVSMNSYDDDSYFSESNESLDRIRESDSPTKSRLIFDSAMPSMLSEFPTMLSHNDEPKSVTQPRSGEVSKRGKRKKYQKYTPQDRVAIGQYCFEHGPAAARKAFQFRYPEMSESVTRGFRDKYKVMIGEAAVYEFEQKRRQNELKERVAPLPRGRPRKYRAVGDNEKLPPITVNKPPTKGKMTFSKRKDSSLKHASMIAPRNDDRYNESPRRYDDSCNESPRRCEDRNRATERSEDLVNIAPTRDDDKPFGEEIVHIVPKDFELDREGIVYMMPRDSELDPIYVSTRYSSRDSERTPIYASNSHSFKSGATSPYSKQTRVSPSYLKKSVSPPYAEQPRYLDTFKNQESYVPTNSEVYEQQDNLSPKNVKPPIILRTYRKPSEVSTVDRNTLNISPTNLKSPTHMRPPSTSANNTKLFENSSRNHGYSSNNSITNYISIAPTSSHVSKPHFSDHTSSSSNSYVSKPPIIHFPRVYDAKKFMAPVSSERSFSQNRVLTNIKNEDYQHNGHLGSPSDSHNNENMNMTHMNSPDIAGGQRVSHIRSKRFKYQKYTPEERFNIGKLCNEIGLNATVKLYREQYPRLNESVVRTFRNRYRELVEQGNGVPEIESIERKPSKRTSVTAMEEEVARQLRQFKISRVELTENLVLAVAENVIASRDPREKFDLQKWVSPIWAQTFLVRKQLVDADDKNKIPVCNKCNTRLICPNC